MAKDQIEITTEMVEAGMDVLLSYDPEGGTSTCDIVTNILKASLSKIPTESDALRKWREEMAAFKKTA